MSATSQKRSRCSPSSWVRAFGLGCRPRGDPACIPPGHPGCRDSTASALGVGGERFGAASRCRKIFLIPGLQNSREFGLIKAKRSEHPEP